MSLDSVLAKLSGVVRAGEGFKALCPSHSDLGPSLSVRPGTGGRVMLHCFAGCHNLDVMQAAGITVAEMSGERGDSPAPPVPSCGMPVREERRDLCHKVYSSLFGMMPLSPAHEEALRLRGLEDGSIAVNRYGTITFLKACQAAKRLHSLFGKDLFDVPGFVLEGSGKGAKAAIRQHDGLMIAVRDWADRIVAVQLRTTDPTRKYVWMSTPGCSSGTPAHMPRKLERREGSVVRLTEGPLKADVCMALDGVPTVAASGALNWRFVLPMLERLKPIRVQIAYDMDLKKPVEEQVRKLDQALRDRGIPTSRLWWPSRCKGLDDALLEGAIITEDRETGRVASHQPPVLGGDDAERPAADHRPLHQPGGGSGAAEDWLSDALAGCRAAGVGWNW